MISRPGPPPAVRRVAARVDGTVQGVGFRPFVHRLAAELGLTGSVRNDERGVVVEVEGTPEAVQGFLVRLAGEAPPLADVRGVSCEELVPRGDRGFAILASAPSDGAHPPSAAVTPDAATCDDCLAELFDPADRRHRYPFVNCTNCGPRFTIVRGVPYDRPLTTMARFTMCSDCRAEYDDPRDRRFHAQPNACPACGPLARLIDGDVRPAARGGDPAQGSSGPPTDALRAAAQVLLAGRILAVKGLGGYHLACRADDERAVAALRSRKHREDRPFALLVRDAAAASELVELGPEEEALVRAREGPIVLARRRPGAAIAASVAPRAPELGVMLPYTPLHHLLAADTGVPLVMTSGNVSDEPIAYRDDEARDRLGPIADALLVHDRPIQTRTDDSVARVVRGRPLLLRRSRGYVPAPLDLPVAAGRPVLACGAELKSTFCVAKGTRAWVGHHIGDLKNYETLRSFRDGVEHVARLFAVQPEVVAHDLHPDYLSTAYALQREGAQLIGVQHHHAHLAAVLAEHGESGPAVGAIFDGTGYGGDGTVWGGELLVGGLGGFRRAGHLAAVRMPGGERAIHEPWRMACAWLVEALGPAPAVPAALAGRVPADRWNAIAELARTGFSSPATTSVGRLFDAVAALCGLRAEVTYEGQAAVELEAVAHEGLTDARAAELAAYPMAAGDDAVLDGAETIRSVVADLAAGVPVGTVAARFHAGVATATAATCAALARRDGLDTVVLAGGVFQNRLLLEQTAVALETAGLRVLLPERLPPNDGAIAYGQAAVAAAGGAVPSR